MQRYQCLGLTRVQILCATPTGLPKRGMNALMGLQLQSAYWGKRKLVFKGDPLPKIRTRTFLFFATRG